MLKKLILRYQLKNSHFDYASLLIDQLYSNSIIPAALAHLIRAFVKRPLMEEAVELIMFDSKFARLMLGLDRSRLDESAIQEIVIRQMPECSRIFRIPSDEDGSSYLFFDARVTLKILEEKENLYLSTEWSRPEYLLTKRWLSLEKDSNTDALAPRSLRHTIESVIPTAKSIGEVSCFCSKCGVLSDLNEVSIESGDEWNRKIGYALGCTRGHLIFKKETTIQFS